MTISLVGILFAQLVLGVLGILLFSGEYATGMIRATLAVVPSRLPVLWAKLIVLVGLMLPLSLLAAVADFFTATALESSRGGSAISLTDPGVLRFFASEPDGCLNSFHTDARRFSIRRVAAMSSMVSEV